MKLKLKPLKWSAGVPVALMNRDTANRLGVHAKERISVRPFDDGKEISAVVDLVGEWVGKKEIAVSSEVESLLNLKKGQKVDISISHSTKSSIYIKKKLKNKALSKKETEKIVTDIVNNSLSEAEVAMFISAMYTHGMSFEETVNLIEAITKTGNNISFDNKKNVVDKHCIGGIAGNRTSPIVVSICAAAGLTFPKTSSRAITSASGTADTMETVAEVDFPIEDIKKIVNKTEGCLVWGGGLGMVPADSKIIQIEKNINLDPEAQLLASIMSKKLSVGSKYILIDIPYGKNAKVSLKKAKRLKKSFEKLGKYFNKKLECVLTHTEEPIGNGVGPALEMRDVINVLDKRNNSQEKNNILPEDLEKKSLFLSGRILEMTGKAKKGKGEKKAKEILDSGDAFEKFKEIVKSQNSTLSRINKVRNFEGAYKKTLTSGKNEKISDIDDDKINSLARTAGCPADKNAGVYLHHKEGEKIEKKDNLITIYADSKFRLKEAVKYYKKAKPIQLEKI